MSEEDLDNEKVKFSSYIWNKTFYVFVPQNLVPQDFQLMSVSCDYFCFRKTMIFFHYLFKISC